VQLDYYIFKAAAAKFNHPINFLFRQSRLKWISAGVLVINYLYLIYYVVCSIQVSGYTPFYSTTKAHLG